MEWLTPILVAIIGGPVMYLLSRLDRINRTQHDEISKKVDRISVDIGDVRKDLHEHISWHLGEEYDLRKQLRKERRDERRFNHEELYRKINQSKSDS